MRENVVHHMHMHVLYSSSGPGDLPTYPNIGTRRTRDWRMIDKGPSSAPSRVWPNWAA